MIMISKEEAFNVYWEVQLGDDDDLQEARRSDPDSYGSMKEVCKKDFDAGWDACSQANCLTLQ